MSREILQEVEEILDDRAAAYGPAEASMATIAARWSITLGRRITPAEVVLCLIDLKLARLAHDPRYRDGVVDVIGYAAMLPEVTR